MSDLPARARAAVLDPGSGRVELRELPVPAPRAGEALLRMTRANVCGSDLHMTRGEAFAAIKPPFSFVLGHEGVGRIAALGAGAGRDARGQALAVGDRVTFTYHRGCGACAPCARGREHACLMALLSVLHDHEQPPHLTGTWAEYYVARRGQKLVKLPDDVPDALAAGCNCALAQVIHGLRAAGVGLGDRVVIQGAGGLGLYATAVAKALGAAQVIALDGVAARLELARAFGADLVISLADSPDPRARTAAVLAATAGGADVVVEVVGKAEALREGVRMLQRGGRYLVMGSIVPRETVALDPSLWVGGNLTILGVSLYEPRALIDAVEFVRAHRDRLPLARMVAEAYPLSAVADALAAADAWGRGGQAARVALDPAS